MAWYLVKHRNNLTFTCISFYRAQTGGDKITCSKQCCIKAWIWICEWEGTYSSEGFDFEIT